MERLKAYLIKHFEAVFALVILVSVASINYFIPYKLVFLTTRSSGSIEPPPSLSLPPRPTSPISRTPLNSESRLRWRLFSPCSR